MKKSIILAAMLSLMATTFAQSENIFNIKHSWMKMVGYSYQPAYPYGFSTAGGSFLSFGFGENGKYFLTNNGAEHIEPTWSMRLGWVGYTFDEDVTDWGAITFRPMLVLGMDMTKDHNLSTGKTEKNTYFTMTPTLAVEQFQKVLLLADHHQQLPDNMCLHPLKTSQLSPCLPPLVKSVFKRSYSESNTQFIADCSASINLFIRDYFLNYSHDYIRNKSLGKYRKLLARLLGLWSELRSGQLIELIFIGCIQ